MASFPLPSERAKSSMVVSTLPRRSDETTLNEFLSLTNNNVCCNNAQVYDCFIMDYEIQLTRLKDILEEHSQRSNKHNLVYCLATFGHYEDTKGTVETLFGRINGVERSKEDNPDFAITALIRLLFTPEPQHQEVRQDSRSYILLSTIKERLVQALGRYSFWPEDRSKNKALDQITFWSENHLLMTLSAGYLFQCYLQTNHHPHSAEWVEKLVRLQIRELLLTYLAAHCHPKFKGFYEVNSIVYMQFTIVALLNLIDYGDAEVTRFAETLLDTIVQQLMCCADPLYGVVNLAASARHYDRVTERLVQFDVNTLVQLMNRGHTQDLSYSPTYISAALVATRWRPKLEAFQALYGENMVLTQKKYSHSIDDLKVVYNDCAKFYGLSVNTILPFYWSAGLLLHPHLIIDNRHYAARHHLTNHPDLKVFTQLIPKCEFPDKLLLSASKAFRHFSKGQVYLNIALNVFKQPRHGLVMSSFELFNPHYCGFQQFPWIINLAGVPIFSRAGQGLVQLDLFLLNKRQTILKQPSMNTHNPAVQQTGDMMLVTYLAHDIMGHTKNKFWQMSYCTLRKKFSWDVQLFWPKEFFDEQVDIPYESSAQLEETIQNSYCDERVGSDNVDVDEVESDEDLDERDYHSMAQGDISGAEENDESLSYYDADDGTDDVEDGCVIEVEEKIDSTDVQSELVEEDQDEEEDEEIVEVVNNRTNKKKSSKVNRLKKGLKKAQKSINRTSKEIGKAIQQVEKQVSETSKHIVQDVSRVASSTASIVSASMNPIGASINAIFMPSRKLMIKNYTTDSAKQAWKWRIGRRGSCYVAFLSTKDLKADGESDQEFEVNSFKARLDVFKSKAKQISFVMVIGTEDQYRSILDFYESKLKHIMVTEFVKSNIYHVVVYDTSSNKMLSYKRNALKPM